MLVDTFAKGSEKNINTVDLFYKTRDKLGILKYRLKTRSPPKQHISGARKGTEIVRKSMQVCAETRGTPGEPTANASDTLLYDTERSCCLGSV
jgi:hypothetical protein